jgi:hypothetical protein
MLSDRNEAARQSGTSELDLSHQSLQKIPDSIAELSALRSLDLSFNRISFIPVWLGRLENLERLNLAGNEIGSLSESLTMRATIPASFARMKNLKDLNLSGNQINNIPSFFWDLGELEKLDLSENRIDTVPKGISRLKKLQLLNLSGNRVGNFPEETTRLASLRQLLLRGNGIKELPESVSFLSGLEKFDIEGNPLPEEFLAASRQGASVLFRYFEKLRRRKVHPRTVKVVLLGEPKSGKTTLLEALRGNPAPCDPGREETMGVDVVALVRPSPDDLEPMNLSVWDFAGQHIEHATHQFFLTEQAIFVILWNARQGTESGKRDLWYWLELLKMRVKDPVYLLVATHIKHTPPDLNLAEIQRLYPGFQGQFGVELEDLDGFAEFEAKLVSLAAASPAMRAEWPEPWLPVRDEVRRLRALCPYTTPVELRRLLIKHGIKDETSQKDLANQLHALGEILYFQGHEELSKLVILDPEWIAELIALVVRSEEVRANRGILSKSILSKLWETANLAPEVVDHLTGVMDWFDLTYSTGHINDVGIVVEALPFSTPEDRTKVEIRPEVPQMEMIFRFPTLQRRLPPGIPTWAIARAHRLSKCKPWADAAAFEDPDTGSEALILASSITKEVRLRVAADYPPFFFGQMEAILRDTFKRYPGIEPERRRLPCCCRKNCPHSYRYETVVRRFRDRYTYVTCDESGDDVQISVLLTGFLGTESPATPEGLRALQAEMRRGFVAQLQALREQSEKTCPSVFTLVPASHFKLLDTWIESFTQDDELELVLYCEHESGWHPTEHGLYRFRADKVWFDAIKKNWNSLLSVTRRVAPFARLSGLAQAVPWLNTAMSAMEKLPDADQSRSGKLAAALGKQTDPEVIDIESRHLMESLISELDASRGITERKNGGLLPWLTDDGRRLWLCPQHTRMYKSRTREVTS